MTFRKAITFEPIGYVRTPFKERPTQGWSEFISEIVLRDELAEGLEGLEEFSHIQVLFWLHRVRKEEKLSLKIHPMGRHDLPLVGLFATRSPTRPNPIGLTTVELLKREGDVLTVSGLDAEDGTPILDIKPYIPGYDGPQGAKVPSWISRL